MRCNPRDSSVWSRRWVFGRARGKPTRSAFDGDVPLQGVVSTPSRQVHPRAVPRLPRVELAVPLRGGGFGLEHLSTTTSHRSNPPILEKTLWGFPKGESRHLRGKGMMPAAASAQWGHVFSKGGLTVAQDEF